MLDTASPPLDYETVSALPEAQSLVEKGHRALRKVAKGEYEALAGWLEYGDVLNAGRGLFPGKENDRAYGAWCRSTIPPNLGDIHDDDRAAAMWAAGDTDSYLEIRAAHPKVRTVRGLHAKWKEAQRPKPKEPLGNRQVPTGADKPKAPTQRTYEVPTADDLRRIESLRVMINYPTIEENVRFVAQRRLDKYIERFGDVSDAQSAEARSFRGSDELGDEIVSLVVSLCQTEYRVRSFLRDAIVHRYRFNKRTSLEDVLATLQQIKRQPAE